MEVKAKLEEKFWDSRCFKYLSDIELLLINNSLEGFRAGFFSGFHAFMSERDERIVSVYTGDYLAEYFIAYHILLKKEMSKRKMAYCNTERFKQYWHYSYRGNGESYDKSELDYDLIASLVDDGIHGVPVFAEHTDEEFEKQIEFAKEIGVWCLS